MDFKKYTDQELVQLSLEDADNFLHLMERYERQLLVYIRRLLTVDLAEAEDILQEVFLKVYQNLNAFDVSLKFSSWIYRICHNQAISHYRKFKNRPRMVDLEDGEVDRIVSDLDVEGDLDKKLLKEGVAEVLGQMDAKYREVLVLKFLEDKDYTEISDILKKPMGSVATLINRAKKKFKDAISRRGGIN